MKNLIILFIILFFGLNGYSQVEGCDCNEIMDKEIRTEFSSYNRNAIKQFIYEYSFLSEKERKKYKKSHKNSFGISAVVEAIPVSLNSSNSGDYKRNTFYSIVEETKKLGYVSDENLNMFSTSFVPDIAFEKYKDCLKFCEIVLLDKKGVRVTVPDKTDEIVILKLEFNSSPGGGKISIKSADYTGCDILHGKKLKPNTTIYDGQIIYEQLKRLPEKDLIITINFNETDLGSAHDIIRAKKKNLTDPKTPVGTIIASTLDYRQFCEVNGYNLTWDLNKSIWAPCDGRKISENSAYGSKRTEVPDLRGVFLRGLNDFKVDGVDKVSDEQADPDPNSSDRTVESFQPDAMLKHRHALQKYTTNHGDGAPAALGMHNQDTYYTGWEGTGLETRPKNIAVYYYIKIR